MSCRIILWSQSTRMLEFKHPMPGRKETSVIEPLKKKYLNMAGFCMQVIFFWLVGDFGKTSLHLNPVMTSSLQICCQSYKFWIWRRVHTSTYKPNKFRIWRRPIINHARTSNIWTKEKHGFQWKFLLKYLINDVFGMSTRWCRPGF